MSLCRVCMLSSLPICSAVLCTLLVLCFVPYSLTPLSISNMPYVPDAHIALPMCIWFSSMCIFISLFISTCNFTSIRTYLSPHWHVHLCFSPNMHSYLHTHVHIPAIVYHEFPIVIGELDSCELGVFRSHCFLLLSLRLIFNKHPQIEKKMVIYIYLPVLTYLCSTYRILDTKNMYGSIVISILAPIHKHSVQYIHLWSHVHVQSVSIFNFVRTHQQAHTIFIWIWFILYAPPLPISAFFSTIFVYTHYTCIHAADVPKIDVLKIEVMFKKILFKRVEVKFFRNFTMTLLLRTTRMRSQLFGRVNGVLTNQNQNLPR